MINLNYPKFWQTRNIISYLLFPLSCLYILVNYLRGLYFHLFCSVTKLPMKVICVGNITVGGTGKTQVVILLINILSKFGIKPLIITNGYKSKIKTAKIVEQTDDVQLIGDEAAILRQYADIIVAKDLSKAVSLIIKLKPKLVILDDRMQNPKIHKDITILCVDKMRGFGNALYLPAGPLRESIQSGFDKSDCIISIGNDNEVENKIGDIILPKYIPRFFAQIKINNNVHHLKSINDKYFAFCGIGNPERFIDTLTKFNINLIGYKFFSDHHHYTSDELKYLTEQSKYATLITTEKDYVKIRNLLPVNYIKTSLELDNITEFTNLLYEKITQTY